MSTKETTVRVIGLVAAMLLIMGGSATGSPPKAFNEWVGVFEPVSHPQGPGPVDLLFRFEPDKNYSGDGVFTIEAKAAYGAVYSGPREWQVTALPGEPHEEVLTMVISPDTASSLGLNIFGDDYVSIAHIIFVHQGDSVYLGHPRPEGANLTDEATQEELDTPWGVEIANPDSVRVAAMERVLGPLKNKPGRKNRYFAIVTLRQLRELNAVEIPFVGPDAANHEALMGLMRERGLPYRNGLSIRVVEIDSAFIVDFCRRVPHSCFLDRDTDRIDTSFESVPDSGSEPQGIHTEERLPAGISLSRVFGMVHPDSVAAIDSVAFSFRVNNTTGHYLLGCSHGFAVYSPDGAIWADLQGAWSPMSDHWFDADYVNYFGNDGFESDTVGFAGFSLFGNPGIPPGDTSNLFTISLDLSNAANLGKEICIDSCFYPPGGQWLWSVAPYSDEFVPDWDGPHCFRIACADLEINGDVLFRDYRGLGPFYPPLPAREVRLSLYEFDTPNPDNPTKIASTTTLSDGSFSFARIENVDYVEDNRRDLILVVEGHSSVARVPDTADLYNRSVEWISDTLFDADCGVHNWSCDIYSKDVAKYFFVLDAIRIGHDFANPVSGVVMPSADECWAIVHRTTFGSSFAYNPSGGYLMFIQDSIDVNKTWPDTWDQASILHEYGHVLSMSHLFADDTVGYDPFHLWHSITGPSQAFIEGFPQFFAATVLDTSEIANTAGEWFDDTLFHNLETGIWRMNGSTYKDTVVGTANCMGLKCEGTVACALWDIIDDQSVLEEFSDSTQWGQTAPVSSADGIGDELTVSIGEVFSILLTTYDSTGQRPDTFEEFWKVWISKGMGYQDEMHAILFEHGIVWDCCRGIRGNVNGDPAELVNVEDITYLLAYLFGGGPPPPCMLEADVDGSGDEAIVDVVYLVDHLFGGGPHPVDCAGLKTHVQQDSEGRDILTTGGMTATSK
jgi:hypothetical protein